MYTTTFSSSNRFVGLIFWNRTVLLGQWWDVKIWRHSIWCKRWHRKLKPCSSSRCSRCQLSVRVQSRLPLLWSRSPFPPRFSRHPPGRSGDRLFGTRSFLPLAFLCSPSRPGDEAHLLDPHDVPDDFTEIKKQIAKICRTPTWLTIGLPNRGWNVRRPSRTPASDLPTGVCAARACLEATLWYFPGSLWLPREDSSVWRWSLRWCRLRLPPGWWPRPKRSLGPVDHGPTQIAPFRPYPARLGRPVYGHRKHTHVETGGWLVNHIQFGGLLIVVKLQRFECCITIMEF